jgi:hypothetical protein
MHLENMSEEDEASLLHVVSSIEAKNKLKSLEQLDQDDRKTIIHVLDSLIRDAKAKKAYEAHG